MFRTIALCALLVACGGDDDTHVEVDGGDVIVNNTTTTGRGVCIGDCPPGGLAGDGDVVSEARDARGFDAILNEAPLFATVTQGDFKIEVRWDSNLVAKVLTSVEGDTLRIRIEDTPSITAKQLGAIAISVPTLRALSTTGSGDMVAIGSGDSLDLSTSGSGEIDTSSFTAMRGNVTTTGSGDIRATYTDSVRASTSGSGDIVLYGGATVTKSETGSGDITAD